MRPYSGVIAYDSQGYFYAVIAPAGSCPVQVDDPRDLLNKDDRLYIADGARQRVQIYDVEIPRHVGTINLVPAIPTKLESDGSNLIVYCTTGDRRIFPLIEQLALND